jgi:alpha-L-rhamnosidase
MIRVLLILLTGVTLSLGVKAQDWKGKWISAANADAPNTWLGFKKLVMVTSVPEKLPLRIAADTKYWLWVNGKMVVFEGGVKRGPTPFDTYYDSVNIAPFVVQGENMIAVLLWHFGKDGYAHKNSGRAGLLIDGGEKGAAFSTNDAWQARRLEAYGTASEPQANFRLAESNLLFDARLDIGDWIGNKSIDFPRAIEKGNAGSWPWNKLINRSIPLFRDRGVKDYFKIESASSFGITTYTCWLPYNAQVHPIMKIRASAAGLLIKVGTSNNDLLTEQVLRGEYITRQGEQEFEFPGWINGEKVIYRIPTGIEVLSVKYRETSFDTEIAGEFISSDTFYNSLWKKASRTLFLSMRDHYMDCPDRERAAWSGDIVSQTAQSFYVLDTNAHMLTRKWFQEILGWRKSNGDLSSPVPAGNIDIEIPDQTLMMMGVQGIWNYYMHTGDSVTLGILYASFRQNLSYWSYDANGLIRIRDGGNRWIWGDRGKNIDMLSLYNMLYAGALLSMQKTASLLGHVDDAKAYAEKYQLLKERIRNMLWNGKAFQSSTVSQPDERVQALAILNGIAKQEDFSILRALLFSVRECSPYMEQFVLQSLIRAGFTREALVRMKERYAAMVKSDYTTLWEGWKIPYDDFGGTTPNHAWAGGAAYLLPQALIGIEPLEPAYRKILIRPSFDSKINVRAAFSSVKGRIEASVLYENGRCTTRISLPPGTTGLLELPLRFSVISLNGKEVWRYGGFTPYGEQWAWIEKDTTQMGMFLPEGNHEILLWSDMEGEKAVLMPISENLKSSSCFQNGLYLTAAKSFLNVIAIGGDLKDWKLRWYKNGQILSDSLVYLNIKEPGAYQASYVNRTGLKINTGIMLVNDKPNMPSIKETSEGWLKSNAAEGFKWYRDGVLINTYAQILKNGIPGIYTHRVEIEGCLSDPSLPANYRLSIVSDPGRDGELYIYPNPVTTAIRIASPALGNEKMTLIVLNASAQKVLEMRNIEQGQSVDLSSLKTGFYRLLVKTWDGSIYFGSIIKE